MLSDNIKDLTDLELDEKINESKGASFHKEYLDEKQRRLNEKEKQNSQIQNEIKTDQKCIKKMTAIILILTAATLAFMIFQYFQPLRNANQHTDRMNSIQQGQQKQDNTK